MSFPRLHSHSDAEYNKGLEEWQKLEEIKERITSSNNRLLEKKAAKIKEEKKEIEKKISQRFAKSKKEVTSDKVFKL